MSLRTPHSALRIRQAFTLAELLVASVSATILLAALGSTMYIARQVAYSPVHAQKLLDGTAAAFALCDEIKHAVYVVDYGATYVEFVTDDRNGDAVEDSIRYAWSGTAGDPLTRSFNRGAPAAVMEDVHQFQLDYTIDQASEDLEVLTAGSEVALAPQYSDDDVFDLQPNTHLSQAIDLSGLPASAHSWSLTKVRFEASEASTDDGQFAVQLRYAASNGTPTSEIVEEFVIDESDLSGGWYTLTPPQPVWGLSPHRNYCIVFQWQAGSEAARIHLSNSPNAAYQTGDNGATWTAIGKWAQVIVYAKPDTATTPLTIHEDRLRCVQVSLQHGDSSFARIDSAVTLDNAPVLVEKAWRAEFDRDPTTQDQNGDGDGDFDYSSGTFDMADVIDGAWQVSGYLRAEHAEPITTPVLWDLRGQCLATGVGGLLARSVVRRAASEYADVSLSVVLESNGTQTARLVAYDGATTHVLATAKELPAEPLDIRLVIEPTRRLAAMIVEGASYPVGTIPPVNGTVSADSFTITEVAANAEFDYASIVICP
jgi:hypothetical protein